MRASSVVALLVLTLWPRLAPAQPPEDRELGPPRPPIGCRTPAWLGEEAGVRGALFAFVGWSGGLQHRIGRCWLVGGGLRAGWDGGRGAYLAAAARLSAGVLPYGAAVYLQAGPGLSEDGLGLDGQLGIDATFAAVFVGAVWEGGAPSGYVGVRVAVLEVTALVLAALAN